MPSPSPASDRYFDQLRKLTEISRALTYTTAPDEVLRLAAERAADLLEAQSALLMLSDEEGMLRVRAAHGVEAEVVERFRDRFDETLIRRLQGLLDAPLEHGFLGVPLVVHGGVTGLLAVVRPGGDPITEEEEWLLSAVADQVAVALENARLEEEVRRERERRERSRGAGDGAPDEAHDRALATLSHDLRAPLNSIDSYAELIEMEILGPVSDRQREALGRIRMNGRHLLAVLESVLEMTRLSAGVVEVQTGPIRTRSVVEEAVLMVRPSATAKEQSLVVDLAADLVVRADPNRLRQVLVNLLGNAIKYTPPGGTVRVAQAERVDDDARWGLITVCDTGPGIPADKLQAVFYPYYRIPSTDGEGSEGTGLGLAISRELVRRMGGDIEVESELGHGCNFTVRLPGGIAPAGDLPSGEAQAPSSNG